jgi:hypothetical protein
LIIFIQNIPDIPSELTSKIQQDTMSFTTIKNSVDSRLTIIRHNESGFYNITKTATMIHNLENESSTQTRCPRVNGWFRSKNTIKLIAEFEQRANVPKGSSSFEVRDHNNDYRGTYAHPVLHNLFMSWVSSSYALEFAMQQYASNREVKQCSQCANGVDGILETVCKSCQTDVQVSVPHSTLTRKEHHFMGPLSKIYGYAMSIDRPIAGGNSSRRPDGFIDKGSYVIIIEVDENQHKAYHEEDELDRLSDLTEDVQGRPIAFIRINPDEYVSASGKLIKSAFYYTEGNALIVRTKEYNRRFAKLCQVIEDTISDPPVSTTTTRLFFDA